VRGARGPGARSSPFPLTRRAAVARALLGERARVRGRSKDGSARLGSGRGLWSDGAEVHHAVRPAGRWPDPRIAHLDDVLIVTHERAHPGLAQEAIARLGVCHQVRKHELERVATTRDGVLGDVDGAHAASLQPLQHPVLVRAALSRRWPAVERQDRPRDELLLGGPTDRTKLLYQRPCHVDIDQERHATRGTSRERLETSHAAKRRHAPMTSTSSSGYSPTMVDERSHASRCRSTNATGMPSPRPRGCTREGRS